MLSSQTKTWCLLTGCVLEITTEQAGRANGKNKCTQKHEGKKDKSEFQGWCVKVGIWPNGWGPEVAEKRRGKKSGQTWKGLCLARS